MTPQEAATACKSLKTLPDNLEVAAFLKSASARDIQTFIHLIQIVDRRRFFYLARVALDVRLSEDAEISTRRIIRLTWVLVALTAALLIFTVALYEDAHAQLQHERVADHATQK